MYHLLKTCCHPYKITQKFGGDDTHKTPALLFLVFVKQCFFDALK